MEQYYPENCVFCKKNPRKEGYALCEQCYDLNEKDRGDGSINFICPQCGRRLGSQTICSKCGAIRTYFMSLPMHCKTCHCQFWYIDKKQKRRCWCCNSLWEKDQCGIDDYIMFAIQNSDNFKMWNKKYETNCPECNGSGMVTSCTGMKPCPKCGPNKVWK